MTKAVRLACALIPLAGLFGCDTIYGIGAEKVVDSDPEDRCVADALKATPGIVEVQTETRINDGWVLLGSGPRHNTPIRYFIYDIAAGHRPSLMIQDDGPGKYLVSHTMLSMNVPIPKADMDKALPIMVAAEGRIARACGVPLDTGMKHECDGSACGP
jgi:hypothetical protein